MKFIPLKLYIGLWLLGNESCDNIELFSFVPIELLAWKLQQPAFKNTVSSQADSLYWSQGQNYAGEKKAKTTQIPLKPIKKSYIKTAVEIKFSCCWL